jgi:hypothetical protein
LFTSSGAAPRRRRSWADMSDDSDDEDKDRALAFVALSVFIVRCRTHLLMLGSLDCSIVICLLSICILFY